MITEEELVRAFKDGLDVEMVYDKPCVRGYVPSGKYLVPEGARGRVVDLISDVNSGVPMHFYVRFGTDIGLSWSVDEIGLRRLRLVGAEPKADLSPSSFPHACPGCGGPAYVGLHDTDCQARCGKVGR